MMHWKDHSLQTAGTELLAGPFPLKHICAQLHQVEKNTSAKMAVALKEEDT